MEAMAQMSGPAAILDIDGTLVDSNQDHELRDAGAVAVFESIDELRRRLSETPLG
jgi:hypothetical protein